MTKQEYLAELRAALSDLSAEEASRACAFYEEMIDDRVEAGEDERNAVAAMEPPPWPRRASWTRCRSRRTPSARRASTPWSRSLPRGSASEARPAAVALP